MEIFNTHCFAIGLMNFKRKYFLIHSHSGTGWHFFDWSVQYLNGQPQYYLFNDRKFVDIVDNPLKKQHAHAHQINVVRDVDQLTDFDQQFNNLDNSDSIAVLQNGINFYTLKHNGVAVNAKDLTVKQREEHSERVTAAIIKLAVRARELGYELLSLDWSPEHQYVPMYQIRQGLAYDTGAPLDSFESIKSWIDTFFPGASDHFDQNVWSQRELVALTMRIPDFKKSIQNQIYQQVSDVTVYSTNDFWFNAENIFLNSHPGRFKLWQEVYACWQKLHDVKLSIDYDEILNCIVTGQSKDLSVYNLNFLKEAFIQHGLIHRYNLNLETWKLENFPNNTLELHKLLKENIHTL